MTQAQTPLQLLERNSIPKPNSGCILWTKAVDPAGYGYFGYKGKMTRAHIATYKERYGALPEGAELHHKCGVKSCINPEHLEALTRLEHKRRHKLQMCRSGKHHIGKETQCVACHADYQKKFGARNAAKYRAKRKEQQCNS